MTAHLENRARSIFRQYFGNPVSEQEGAGHYFDDADFQKGLDWVHLAGGDWLFHQNDIGDSLYLLVRGRLQVWHELDRHGPLATPQLIGRITPGDSVGELALLTGTERSAGIRAVRDSSLIRIDRAAFDRIGMRHPKLLLKLAARAAQLAQQSTLPVNGPTRNLSTIAVLPLDGCERSQQFCRELSACLQTHGCIAWLDYAGLRQQGAPVWQLPEDGSVPDTLINWVHLLEDETRLLVYQCDAAASSWTRFCLRQADLVVLVAAGNSEPDRRECEQQLGLAENDATARRMLVLLQPEDGGEIKGTADWYRARQLDFHIHVRANHAEDMQRLARVLVGKATGLVLGAGASRGFAHLGVIKALEEAGRPVDWIGGTSIGAIMGATSAMGWKADRCIELMRHAFVRGRPFSDYTVPLVSLLSGGRMRRMLRQHADLQIEDMPIPFFCISSCLDDGTANFHDSGSLARALSATASMPGILPPTVVNGRLAVDGAVLDSLPVDAMWRQPVGEVIAVSLAAHGQVEVDYTDTPSAWVMLRSKLLPFTRRYRVPAMMTVVLKATELATLADLRAQGKRASLLLEPDVKHFGLTEVNSFERIVAAGYDCAVATLRKIS